MPADSTRPPSGRKSSLSRSELAKEELLKAKKGLSKLPADLADALNQNLDRMIVGLDAPAKTETPDHPTQPESTPVDRPVKAMPPDRSDASIPQVEAELVTPAKRKPRENVPLSIREASAKPGVITPAKRRRKKPVKRDPDALSIHKGTGYWCKKFRGRVLYFGRVADDPEGIAAKDQWLKDKADLLAGREPGEPAPDSLTVEALCFKYLEHHEGRRNTGEISPRTFQGLVASCKIVAEFFGRKRAVVSLGPEDFGRLRAHLSKDRKLVALGNEVIRVRSLFKWAFKNDKIGREIKFGSLFDKPKPEAVDRAREAHRDKHGDKMFEAAEIRKMLDGATQPLRSMILLAANCGFGQSDLAALPVRAVNLDSGWLDFARVKTAVRRRIWLWPETIAAIREWLQERPKAKDEADAGLLFLTVRGSRWVKLNKTGSPADALGQEFRKILDRFGLKRPGVSFYALRHGFETVAGETADQVAVDRIMGHKTPGMSSTYTERIGDDRLRRVSEYVRAWLFGESSDDTTGPDGTLPIENAAEPHQEPDTGNQGPALRLYIA